MEKNLIYLIFAIAISGCASKGNISQIKDQSIVRLVSINTHEGVQLFNRAEFKVDFFPLANNFQSQGNGAFCGPATASIILNALNMDSLRDELIKVKKDTSTIDPELISKDRDPFVNRFSQINIFDASYNSADSNKKIKPKEIVLGKMVEGKRDGGIQLRQYNSLFEAHGLKSDLHVVSDDIKIENIRSEIVKNLSEPGNYVVVNYKRSVLGQNGGGHISPLGAYDKESDSVLVMDVNPAKADWSWVKIIDLVNAMKTLDATENRGYLLISK